MSELNSVSSPLENTLSVVNDLRTLQSEEKPEQSLSKELQDLIDQHPTLHSDLFLELVKTIAPYNIDLAKKYANRDRVRSDQQVKAYILISTYLPPLEAQDVLNAAKNLNLLDTSDLKCIYQEEARRFLPGAQSSFQLIKNRCSSDKAYAHELLDFAELTCHEKNHKEILEKTHQKVMGTMQCLESSDLDSMHLLCPLLNIEAKANSILTFETLDILRSQPEKIREKSLQMFKDRDGKAYAEVLYIEAWIRILSLEANDPFLKDQFLSDFPKVLQIIENYQKEYAEDEDLFECDYGLQELSKALVASHPKEAERVLYLIKKNYIFMKGMTLLLEKNNSHPEINKERMLQEMEDRLANEPISVFKVRMLLDAFRCKALVHCLDLARPYLEQARTLMQEINDEDCEHQKVLCDILTGEMDYNLPSFSETFKELQEIVKRADYVDIDTIPVLVKAEIHAASH